MLPAARLKLPFRRGERPREPLLSKTLPLNLRFWVALRTEWVQFGSMKTSVDLDDDLTSEVDRVVDLIKEKPATVLRMAIRAGLPLVAVRHQAPRPDGYFAADYPMSAERQALETAMGKGSQRPER